MKCWLRKKSFPKIVFKEELVEKFITKILNVIPVAVGTRLRLVVVVAWWGTWGLMGQWKGVGRVSELDWFDNFTPTFVISSVGALYRFGQSSDFDLQYFSMSLRFILLCTLYL